MKKRFGAAVLSMILVISALLPLVGCSSDTYKPEEKSPTVSVPVISTDGVLRVGVDAHSSPYAGTTSSSGIVGINVDIAAAIADEYGLKLEIVDYGSDPAAALEAGTVDIVMGIDKTSGSQNFWVSDAYIESGVALFSTDSNVTLPTDGSAKIAAQASSMSAWEVSKQFGDESLVSTEDLKTAFSDLDSGTVGFVAADAVIGTFAAQQNGSDAIAVGLMQTPTGYGIGVLDDNADLKQLISDTLVKFEDNGMIALIETKWLGVSYDFSTMPRTTAAAEATGDEGAATGDGGDATAEGEGEAAPEGDATAGGTEGDGTTDGTGDGTAEGEGTGTGDGATNESTDGEAEGGAAA